MDTPTSRIRRRRAPAGAGWVTSFLVILTAGALLVGCASFPDSSPTVTVQPSLSPVMPSVIPPSQPAPATSSSSPTSPSTNRSSPSSASTTTTVDPCAPTDPAVVATCLSAPWGLAPLPDGTSALVGERTTGKIFRVGLQMSQTLVTTITGIDARGDGGLLGIALSPYYDEDGLIYAYITTDTDNRIVRFAPGQKPKPILTGIPKGSIHNGGPIAFGSDNYLYVATGDAGDPKAAALKTSLAGKVLRVDTFGKPAAGNPAAGNRAPATSTSPAPASPTPTNPANPGAAAVYASGLTDPTGICPLPDKTIAVVDHRPGSDLLIPIVAGRDYRTPASGDTLWTYAPGDGGGVDCAVSAGYLLATSLSAAKITGVQLAPSGGFTGSPQDLVKGRYGRLLSLATGARDLVWATTSNKDGHGKPIPSDDRVIVLPAAAGGGGGGGPD